MLSVIADSFQQSLAQGATWDFVVANTGRTSCRIGWITAAWDQVDDSTPVTMTELASADIGDTSEVTFIIDKSASTIQFNYVKATSNVAWTDTTGVTWEDTAGVAWTDTDGDVPFVDSWSVKVIRRLLCQ